MHSEYNRAMTRLETDTPPPHTHTLRLLKVLQLDNYRSLFTLKFNVSYELPNNCADIR